MRTFEITRWDGSGLVVFRCEAISVYAALERCPWGARDDWIIKAEEGGVVIS